jgi:hypothetical protein
MLVDPIEQLIITAQRRSKITFEILPYKITIYPICLHLIQACKDVMAQALADCDRSQIKALAVSGQQHGLVVLDSDNKVIRPAKLWCDLESAKEAQELSEAFHTTIVPSFTSKLIIIIFTVAHFFESLNFP